MSATGFTFGHPFNTVTAPVLNYPALPTPKRPHRCPICNGKGTVPAGFYDLGPAGNTIREALEWGLGWASSETDMFDVESHEAFAALDALLAQVAEAERERDEWCTMHQELARQDFVGRAERAEESLAFAKDTAHDERDGRLRAEAEAERLQKELDAVRGWFESKPWEGTPDGSSFGCGDYSPNERAIGYGTYRDPRFLPSALRGGDTG